MRSGRRPHRRALTSLLATPASIFGASAVRLDLRRTMGITYGTPPAVAAWADQSSSTNDAVQSTAGSRPSLTADGVDFDGTDDHLVVADDASLDLSTAMMIGLRVRWDTVAADGVVLSKGATTGGSWALQMVGSQNRLWVRFGAGGMPFYGRLTAVSASTWYSLVIVYDGTQGVANNRMKAWWNGTADAGIAYTGTIPATLPVTTDDVVVGRWLDAAQRFNGQIRAVVIAASSDTSKVSALTNYLNGC